MSCIHDISYSILHERNSPWIKANNRTLESLPFVKGNVDQIYKLESDKQLLIDRPWRKDVHYFNKVYISSLALIKMAIHAKSGGSLEIMGMMTGKIVPSGIVVMDCYALPIEGTETRVNAQSEGYEFMVQYLESSKKIGREENIVGWYHSHPGYGCWLSGIDVATQALNQNFQDPYLAIVIDPLRGDTFGKVEIGCFRTFPPEHTAKKTVQPKKDDEPITKSILQEKKKRYHLSSTKSKDLGIHASRYYQIEIEVFKSSLDTDLLDFMATKQSWDSLLCSSDEVSKFNVSVELDQIEALNGILTKNSQEHNALADHSQLMLDRAKLTELYAGVFELLLSKRSAGSGVGGWLLSTPEDFPAEYSDMVAEGETDNNETPSHIRKVTNKISNNKRNPDDMVDDDLDAYKSTFDRGTFLGDIDEIGGEDQDQEPDTDTGTDAPEEDNGSTSDSEDDDANSMVEEQHTRVSMARRLLTRASRGINTPKGSSRERKWASLRSSSDGKDDQVSNNVYAVLESRLQQQNGNRVVNGHYHGGFNDKGRTLSQQIAARSLQEIYTAYIQERLFQK